jgi:putative transposase
VAAVTQRFSALENRLRPFQPLEQEGNLGTSLGSFEQTASKKKSGRSPCPSYGILDSQSVKTQYDSEERGIDGGKKVKGRKRHIVVDIVGNLLHVQVHAANVHDTVGACEVLRRCADKHPSLQAFSGDAGYRGTAVQ